MNERILELARQVWPDPNISHVNHTKFAELIVRECADIAKGVDGVEGGDYKSGRTWAGIDVLKHFGVEE